METKMIRVPFEVELAKRITNGELEGRVVTRDGRNARVVCWDKKDKIYTIIGLCNCPNSDNEFGYYYTIDGYFDHTKKGYSQDLMLEVPEYMTFKDGDVIACDEYNNISIIQGDIKSDGKYLLAHYHVDLNKKRGLLFYDEDIRKVLNKTRKATEEEKQKLINALKASTEPKAKEYLKRFFGIEVKQEYEFKPFDKVLARYDLYSEWCACVFSHKNEYGQYICCGSAYNQCILYNEQTAHLLGTTDNLD